MHDFINRFHDVHFIQFVKFTLACNSLHLQAPQELIILNDFEDKWRIELVARKGHNLSKLSNNFEILPIGSTHFSLHQCDT